MESKETYNSPVSLNADQPKGKTGSIKDNDLQVIIGWILRVGVIVSMSLVFVGGIVFLYRHGHSIPAYKPFKGVPPFIQGIPGILNGVISFKGQAIIQLGIVLLIATPIIRVAFSAIGFLLEKDYLYTFITLIVLLIIIASMISGHAG
ncbi:MAG TPA: DUF1634 domain-containing protein [Mucilaginibacter sp.]|jgi:uncharacterized membrane protein|nr:DUF1634 domain-containing protein [Mucilaginibacter sp.]